MLKMGCFQADVTPTEKLYLRGYASRNTLSAIVEEKLSAGVIVLEQDNRKVLLLTCDTAGFTMDQCARIRTGIMEKFPFREEEIFICASHTHFAPGISPYVVCREGGELHVGYHDEEKNRYFDFLMDRVLQGITFSLDSMEEIRLLQADLSVSSVAFNRRTLCKENGKVVNNYTYPEDPQNYDFTPIDTTLHVWKFQHKVSGEVKALLARYGCHPVTGGENINGISSDYVGYFREALRREMDCEAFFMLGTAGDVVPLQRQGKSRRLIGETLANAVILGERLFRDTTNSFTLQCSISGCDGRIPFMKDKTPAQLQQNWEQALDKHLRKVQDPAFDFYMESMRYEAFKRYGAVPQVSLSVHLLRLGDHTLAGLPFEVLTDVGEEIRKKIPSSVIVSVCGGYEGYLPLAQDFPKGGYETDQGSVFAPGTGDRIVEHTIKALEEFAAQ